MSSTLKEAYLAACERTKCKPNSQFLKTMDTPEAQTVLDLSSNYCGSERAFEAVLEVIKVNHQLQMVDLSDNYLSMENIRSLVEVLLKHPSVSVVRLNNNRLYIDAGKDLVRLARGNHRIVDIDIDDRSIKNTNKVPAKILSQLNRELTMNREGK